MILSEAVRTGIIEIYSHKMRSFLSFAAIAFGVAAILYTFASVNRMYQRREKAFDLAGPGRLEIRAKWLRGDAETPGLSKGLTTSDADAIAEMLPWLHMVSPTLTTSASFRYGDFEESVSVAGILPEWRKRDWVYDLRGRFLSDVDAEAAARVCLLEEPGGWADEKKKPFWAKWRKEERFESFVRRHELVGETVRLNDTLFTVVGVLRNPPKDKDPRWFRHSSSGGTLYIPLTSAQRYLSSSQRGGTYVPDAVSQIVVDTGDEETAPAAKRRIENLLKVRHRGVEDFEIQDYREMVQSIQENMRKFAIAVMAVGVIAILAGGVGIMNVTLATIFSRIREIGIRRALGATRGDILFQFVTEAMLLGFLGGIAGISLGLAGLKYLTDDPAETIKALAWWHFLATLGISIGAGFLFSLYPAYQASNLDPVEALRYE